jgi:hypothetical protein
MLPDEWPATSCPATAPAADARTSRCPPTPSARWQPCSVPGPSATAQPGNHPRFVQPQEDRATWPKHNAARALTCRSSCSSSDGYISCSSSSSPPPYRAAPTMTLMAALCSPFRHQRLHLSRYRREGPSETSPRSSIAGHSASEPRSAISGFSPEGWTGLQMGHHDAGRPKYRQEECHSDTDAPLRGAPT